MSILVASGWGLIFTVWCLEIPVPVTFLIVESPTIKIFSFFQLTTVWYCLLFHGYYFFWYFIWSCNLLVTISFAVISFFFMFVNFILAIFFLHPILIKIMIDCQKFIILIILFLLFFCLFLISSLNSWFFIWHECNLSYNSWLLFSSFSTYSLFLEWWILSCSSCDRTDEISCLRS